MGEWVNRSWVGRWAKFLLGLGGIWIFVFVLAPWLQGFEPIGTMHEFVRESGIDAGAIYYTDLDEFGDAEVTLRNSIAY